jgi:hypothetical protein
MNIEKNINYNELVNPTFTTGQATLEMLAASGNPDAIIYKEMLGVAGVTDKVGGNANEGAKFFSPEEGKALMKEWGIPEQYQGIGNVILGYGLPEGKKDAAPRKADYVFRI